MQLPRFINLTTASVATLGVTLLLLPAGCASSKQAGRAAAGATLSGTRAGTQATVRGVQAAGSAAAGAVRRSGQTQ